MKKFLAIAVLMLCTQIVLSAQSLQFNRVINLKGLHSGGWTQLDTVPADKVWKVENYNVSSYNSLGSEVSPGSYLQWNQAGSGMYVFMGAPNGSSTIGTVSQPIWLEAGEGIWIARFTGGDGGYFISIIEFNVVP